MANIIKLKPKVLFLYPGQSRQNRISGLESGSAPQDFFYGLPGAMQAGYDCVIGDTRSNPKGLIANYQLKWEIFRNRFTRFGFSKQRVKALSKQFENVDIAISFTDFFSLSMGLWVKKSKNKPLLIGGFHGLSDQIEKTKPFSRKIYNFYVKKALENLDHIFFFGAADRALAIKLYDLREEKTSLLPFGVDTKFWAPKNSESTGKEDYALAVGSDPQRDFATLVASPIDIKVKILTRLKIQIPHENKNIELLRGSFYESGLTDTELRAMYMSALAIVVPLKDVNQPSGYSVTLQAMACGKPVVLTKTRGLWDSHLFKSGVNCILVNPYSPREIADAINNLRVDKILRAQIGNAARETVQKYFEIGRMNNAIISMIESTWSNKNNM